MVLSNTKLKRKKREEAAAVAVLNPPPDSNATSSSLAHDVKGDAPAILSAKKKKNKRPKSKAVNGVEKDGVPEEDISITNSIPEVSVEENVLQGSPVQQSKNKKKKLKTVSGVGSADVTPIEGVGKVLPSAGDAGVSEENVPEAGPGQEGAPKVKKIRKKPRWEVDEN